MGKIEQLTSNLSNAANNINIYGQEIDSLTEKIDGIIDVLKENDPYNADLNNSLSFYLTTSVSDFSTLEIGIMPITTTNFGDEIIDYSVDASNLTLKETISVNGKEIKIYKSNKTDALYVISNGLSEKEKKQLTSKLKSVLSNDQMAIVTYHNDYYKYNIKNANGCTRDYSVVGKTSEGKMYAFTTTKNSEIVVDGGGKNDTLITSINGMIIANRMQMTLETGTKISIRVRPKDNVDGGQIVTEFDRLSFSCGVNKSLGNEYGTVRLEGEWHKFENTKENKANGTWVNENANNYVVTVGDGPQRKYFKKYKSVGHVDTKVIPITIQAGNKDGGQHMQGTVCYHHDGNRPGHMSKDMLLYSQKIVSDWNKI